MELRWYQDEAVDSIWEYFANGGQGNPLVALPTGTGKSIVIGEFIRRVIKHYPGQRIIKLTHVKELIQQNFTKLLELWPLAPAGIYSAGLNRRECQHPITFAGIASVTDKAKLFGTVDLVLIDESHLLGPKDDSMYRGFLADLKAANPDLKVIGFTATPYRIGQGLLTDGKGLFTDICYDLTGFDGFNKLLADGFLAPLVPKRPSQELDVSQVGTTAGDYNLKQLEAAVDKDSITKAAVDELMVAGTDRAHWLVFATGVAHADHIATMLNERGVPTVSIHSKMEGDRDKAIRDWKGGKYRCAVNNNILTTGIDFPAIDLIGVLRPTKSTVLWVQMLGRGTRPFPGKNNCLVLDFAGNTARLGPINDPVIPRAKGKKGKGEAPAKLCPACSTWNHTSVRFCVNCGQEFTAAVKITEKAASLDLISKGEPLVLDFNVLTVTYEVHQPRKFGKPDLTRPPSLKVVYHCEDTPVQYMEWLAFESESGLAKHKARDWWRKRSGSEPPSTTGEARARVAELAEPRAIQVWVNTRYPEIMAYDYTGAGFTSK